MRYQSEVDRLGISPAQELVRMPNSDHERIPSYRLRRAQQFKQTYLERKRAGLCAYGHCPVKTELGHVYCEEHLLQLRKSAKTRTDKRMVDGICSDCGQRPQFWGRRCIICRQRHAAHPLPSGARTALRLYRKAEERRRSKEVQRDTQRAAIALLASEEIAGKNAEALRLYLGLDEGNSRTMSEVGRIMNLSRERVRQLLLPSKVALDARLSDRVDLRDLESEGMTLNASHNDCGAPSGRLWCVTCDNAGLRIRDDQVYAYNKCGLMNVVLFGVTFTFCEMCGDKGPIPRIADLHNALAKSILLKPALLSGKESRFLRTHANVSPVELAHRLGVDFATILSWERCEILRFPNDLAMRIICANLLWPTEDYLMAKIARSIQPRRSKPFQLKAYWINEQSGWTTSAEQYLNHQLLTSTGS